MAAEEVRIRRQIERISRRLARGGDLPAPNRNAVAILAVESVRRPRAQRLVEYGAWALYSTTRSDRLLSLSVGRAQLQLRYWRKLGLLARPTFSIASLRHVLGMRANYDACVRFLEACDATEIADPRALTRVYTGGRRPEYVRLVSHAFGSLP